jgi:hypothetical protein
MRSDWLIYLALFHASLVSMRFTHSITVSPLIAGHLIEQIGQKAGDRNNHSPL